MDEFDRLLGARRFAEAEQLARKSVLACEAADGPESLEVARHLARLAFVCEELSRCDEAETHYERALAIREKILGAEHPDIVTNLLNLGALLNQRGNPSRATELLRRAIAIHARTDNPDGEFLVHAMNELVTALAASSRRTGDYAEITDVFKKLAELCEQSLGGDELALALTLHNLGEICRQRNQLSAAREFLERALALREHALGPHHSATLNTAGTLAAVHNDQDRYDIAEPLLRRVLDASEEHEVDPGVRCMALNNLAFLHERQGREDAALWFYRQGLDLCRQVHGPNHFHTLRLERCVFQLSSRLGHSSVKSSLPALLAAGVATFAAWMASLFMVIGLFGGSTEMWPAFVAAVPAAFAGAYVHRRVVRSS